MSAKRKSSALSTPAHRSPKRPREQAVAESGAESSSESSSELASQSGSGEVINVDDLDLNVSYVGKINMPSPPVRPKRKRWTHKGKKPITLMTKVPRGWNDQEPDLDPD